MKDLMEEFGIDETQKRQVLRLKIRQRGMEPVLRFFFREKKIQLSLYNYPREWVAILTEKEWKRLEFPSFLKTASGECGCGNRRTGILISTPEIL